MAHEFRKEAKANVSGNMPAFEKVWQLLHELEGEEVATFATRHRHRYQVVKVLPGGVLRRAKESAEWKRETLVSKSHFLRTWNRLALVGVCGMEEQHTGFVAACLTRLPGLDVWYANTGKGWGHRTLLVLGNPASGDIEARNCAKVLRQRDYSRIVADPMVCSGSPTIRGTRVMVGNVLGLFAGGYTANAILETYPRLSMQDVEAALEYSRVKVDGE